MSSELALQDITRPQVEIRPLPEERRQPAVGGGLRTFATLRGQCGGRDAGGMFRLWRGRHSGWGSGSGHFGNSLFSRYLAGVIALSDLILKARATGSAIGLSLLLCVLCRPHLLRGLLESLLWFSKHPVTSSLRSLANVRFCWG